MRRFIVLDTPNRPFHHNRIFDPEVARRYPGGLVAVRFYELATRDGYRVVTCDLVDTQGISPREAILLTEQWSPHTSTLLMRGALPGIVISHETLWHAWAFYSKLRRISKLYEHVFLFEGAREWVENGRAIFHRAYFPQARREVEDRSGLAWGDKNFLALINSNIPPPSGLRYRLACLREPALCKDLYAERLRAIAYFSRKPGFHLYGRGWAGGKQWLSTEVYEGVLRCYQGECVDKVATLAQYRFGICFENTRFKGYVTEKIFDCFFAGCIPIYYGAPDVEQYVPNETFIDFREFNTYEDLDAFLAGMTPTRAERYLSATRDFLHSAAFELFHQDSVAKKLLDVVNTLNESEVRQEPALTTRLWLMADIAQRAGKRRIQPLWRLLRGVICKA